MNRWIALLRGVNVGGHNKLPMKALRDAMEAGGFSEVQTYIQSGNIVFSSRHSSAETAGDAVTGLIKDKFGFAPRSHILSSEAFEAAIAANPYAREGEAEPKSVHFFFLAEPAADADLDAVAALKGPAEQFALTDQVFYLLAPDGIGRSRLVEKVEKYVPVPMTARNFRTVQKVAELARA